MTVHDLIDLDPERRVVNPARRNLGKKIKKITVRLGNLVDKTAKKKGAEAESPRPSSMNWRRRSPNSRSGTRRCPRARDGRTGG